MKITLDEDVIAEAIVDYLDAKGFDTKKVELKAASSYGAITAEIELKTEEPPEKEGHDE